MFTRPEGTYDLSPGYLSRILADPTNPLHRVAQLVRPGAKVLDVGAGNGLLGEVLHAAHDGIVLDGIEPNAYAADAARDQYRTFHVGFLEEHLDAVGAEEYDFVVLADVIEHVPDPLALLRSLREAVSGETRVLISTPNVAFGALRISLLEGRFDYVDSGLLERTHLRFFTERTLLELFRQAEFHVERQVLHQKGFFGSEIALRPSVRTAANLATLMRDPLASTYQFFFVLSPQSGGATEVEHHGRRSGLLEIAAWWLGRAGALRRRVRGS